MRDEIKLLPAKQQYEGVQITFTPEQVASLLSALAGRGTRRGGWTLLRDAAEELGIDPYPEYVGFEH